MKKIIILSVLLITQDAAPQSLNTNKQKSIKKKQHITRSSKHNVIQKNKHRPIHLATKFQPDFMIIGVTKCGTTSLYSYMTQHPKVLGGNDRKKTPMENKEQHFFDRNYNKGLDWYKKQFPNKKPRQLIGEATPGYFWKRGCLAKIAKDCPDTKFIVIFRDPVKRIISEYFRRQERAEERRSFEKAIQNSKEYDQYLGAGIYIEHLNRWLTQFPKNQIYIVILEELIKNPDDEINKIFTFLGIKKHTLHSYPPHNKASYDKSIINQKTIDDLYDFYQPYNNELEAFLGRKLPWGTSK